MEMTILRALGFKIGAPTCYEFLLRKIEDLGLAKHAQKACVTKTARHLCTMAAHNAEFSVIAPSDIAAACLYIAAKMCDKTHKTALVNLKFVTVLSGDVSVLSADAKTILGFAQNFDKEFSTLQNLKQLGASEHAAIVAYRQ